MELNMQKIHDSSTFASMLDYCTALLADATRKWTLKNCSADFEL